MPSEATPAPAGSSTQGEASGPVEIKPVKKSATFRSLAAKRDKDGSKRLESGLFDSVVSDPDAMKDALDIASVYRERNTFTGPGGSFPELDYVQPYGLSESSGDAKEMWKAEADRLIEAMISSNAPLYEDPGGSPMELPQIGEFSGVAQRLGWALCIYRVDFETALMESKVKHFDATRLAVDRRSLERRLNHTSKIRGLNANNLAKSHAMLNLVSSTVARIAVKIIDELWQPKFLAAVAKVTTKLKLICAAPHASGLRAVRNSQRAMEMVDLMDKMGLRRFEDDNMDDGGWEKPSLGSSRLGELSETFQQGLGGAANVSLSSRNDAQGAYFAEMYVIRVAVLRIFGSIISNFQANSSLALSEEAFEITSLLFSTSYSHSRTSISQDRDAEIVASSSAASLDVADYAMDNMCSIATRLHALQKEGSDKHPPRDGGEPLNAMSDLNWEYIAVTKLKDGSVKEIVNRDSLPIKTTCEFATIVVALCCTMPVVTTTVVALNNTCSMLTTGSSPPKPPTRYSSAVFALTTSAYQDEHLSMTEGRRVTSISKSLLARNGALAWSPPVETVGPAKDIKAWKDAPSDSELQRIKCRTENLSDLDKKINNEWELDECSITLSCWKYSTGVGLICVLLVGGGLAVGFTVGEGIPGVDPFNLAVFAWGFAAFILVVAKSIRVTDWPWRDFLRGRVVCRSISEVCAVTRKVEAQDIIAWLLQNEATTVIRTRGPYNKLFVRRVEDGPAFSIDVEIDLPTLVLCGIIIVEVQRSAGVALVCLNARPGVVYRAFIHSQEKDDESLVWVCEDPPGAGNLKDAATLVPRQMEWHKVVGIYNVGGRKFR